MEQADGYHKSPLGLLRNRWRHRSGRRPNKGICRKDMTGLFAPPVAIQERQQLGTEQNLNFDINFCFVS